MPLRLPPKSPVPDRLRPERDGSKDLLKVSHFGPLWATRSRLPFSGSPSVRTVTRTTPVLKEAKIRISSRVSRPVSGTVRAVLLHRQSRGWRLAAERRNPPTQGLVYEWLALQRTPFWAERGGAKDLPKSCHLVPLCATRCWHPFSGSPSVRTVTRATPVLNRSPAI